MKKRIIAAVISILSVCSVNAQVKIGNNPSSISAKAILEMEHTSKGMLLPRITDTSAIVGGGQKGLVIFSNADSSLYYHDGTRWRAFLGGNGNGITASPCGLSFTVYHSVGSVAPVSKRVTYNTVISSQSGSEKCWITKNLGASVEPSSVTDATEASAGWYWQFNRAQGFKHDGTIRTPASTWITPISENSNWTNANDPCALLLSSGWRLPTRTEWQNVDANGGWTNYFDAFGSAFTLHGGGMLSGADGSLLLRGSLGFYWSSSQNIVTSGYYLRLASTVSVITDIDKTAAFPARCIRDY